MVRGRALAGSFPEAQPKGCGEGFADLPGTRGRGRREQSVDIVGAEWGDSLMKRILPLLPILAALTGGGCAWYNIQPIARTEVKRWGEAGKPLAEGYIFYQPELYFSATIATETVKNKLGEDESRQTVSVAPLYLPNYSKPYRMTTHNLLGKSDFGFDFENGWKLTRLSDKADNSTLANTLAGQLDTLLKATGGTKAIPGATKTRAVLYRPIFNEVTGYFEGFEPVNIRLNE